MSRVSTPAARPWRQGAWRALLSHEMLPTSTTARTPGRPLHRVALAPGSAVLAAVVDDDVLAGPRAQALWRCAQSDNASRDER